MQRDRYGQWVDLSTTRGPQKTIHFECGSNAPRSSSSSLGRAVLGAMFEAMPGRALARVTTAATSPSGPTRTISMHAVVGQGKSPGYEKRAADQVCRIYGGATRLLPSISGGDVVS